jgi:hypothetical protein
VKEINFTYHEGSSFAVNRWNFIDLYAQVIGRLAALSMMAEASGR